MTDLQNPPVTVEQMTDDISKQFDTLFKKILGDNRTKAGEQLVLSMEMNTRINQITVSVSETRQVQDYSPNNYFCSAQVDFTSVWDLIQDQLRSVPKDKLAARFMELRTAFTSLVRAKYESTENFLKSLLKLSEEKDGLVLLGRHGKSQAPR